VGGVGERASYPEKQGFSIYFSIGKHEHKGFLGEGKGNRQGRSPENTISNTIIIQRR